MERCRMVFSGSGGQGVITAAIILAEAAVLHDNLTAIQSQAYGPEARGGATRSDVIISDTTINFPKVVKYFCNHVLDLAGIGHVDLKIHGLAAEIFYFLPRLVAGILVYVANN